MESFHLLNLLARAQHFARKKQGRVVTVTVCRC
jgi:hypothetical protein